MATDGDLAEPVVQNLTKRKLLRLELDWRIQQVTITWGITDSEETILEVRPTIALTDATELKSYLDALTGTATGPAAVRTRTATWLTANRPEAQ